ncbi:hypothetical protein EVAR_99606_1 [Eumeta japonica]|uniref:Uncharacterized protein n=1 Tax=Eumeta variegata TaxID=151549 RepID=A0A4C1ZV20_EUMVA|nr:hypothetical protein EVAR_99606_1 [Eumeta japonica]
MSVRHLVACFCSDFPRFGRAPRPRPRPRRYLSSVYRNVPRLRATRGRSCDTIANYKSRNAGDTTSDSREEPRAHAGRVTGPDTAPGAGALAPAPTLQPQLSPLGRRKTICNTRITSVTFEGRPYQTRVRTVSTASVRTGVVSGRVVKIVFDKISACLALFVPSCLVFSFYFGCLHLSES